MIDRIVVWALSLKARASEERGQDVMEYAVLTGVIAIAILVAVVAFSTSLSTFFTDLGTWVTDHLPVDLTP